MNLNPPLDIHQFATCSENFLKIFTVFKEFPVTCMKFSTRETIFWGRGEERGGDSDFTSGRAQFLTPFLYPPMANYQQLIDKSSFLMISLFAFPENFIPSLLHLGLAYLFFHNILPSPSHPLLPVPQHGAKLWKYWRFFSFKIYWTPCRRCRE